MLELKTFIGINNIDIMLITKTHFTNKNFFFMSNYKFYHTMHPDSTAHGGTAILIKNNIKHHVTNPFRERHIQSTNIVVEDWVSPIICQLFTVLPNSIIRKSNLKISLTHLDLAFLRMEILTQNMYIGDLD